MGRTILEPRQIGNKPKSPGDYHLPKSVGRVSSRAGIRPMAVCKDPQQQQDIPRVMEIAKKFGLEFLPSPGV